MQGLAALIRVSLVSHNPIPLSEMADEDIHHVRKLLQLVSLPFDSSSDHDFQRVMAILQVCSATDSSSFNTINVGVGHYTIWV